MVLLAYALSFLTQTQELADLTSGLLRRGGCEQDHGTLQVCCAFLCLKLTGLCGDPQTG